MAVWLWVKDGRRAVERVCVVLIRIRMNGIKDLEDTAAVLVIE